jgi:hypothetical protein
MKKSRHLLCGGAKLVNFFLQMEIVMIVH